MDQRELVADALRLIERLESDALPVKAAVLLHDSDQDQWRLLLVPVVPLANRAEFYRRVATCLIADPPIDLGGASIQPAAQNDRLFRALDRRGDLTRSRGRAVHLTNTSLDGLFVTDAIVLPVPDRSQPDAA